MEKKICYFTQILKYTKFVKPKFLDSYATCLRRKS